MRQAKIFILLVVLWVPGIYSIQPIDKIAAPLPLSKVDYFSNDTALLERADMLYNERKYADAVTLYLLVLENNSQDPTPILRKLALSQAALNNPTETVKYIEQYLLRDFDIRFLANNAFYPIENSPEFKSLSERFSPKFDYWSFLFLYVALIGFYIAIVLLFNQKVDSTARAIISSFIFIHSIFILHICFGLTHYQYQFPHSYRMSTGFSFLYGPLLYFYFKRITLKYKFKKTDLLHLVPTLVFLAYLLPGYLLSPDQKLDIMLNRFSTGRGFSDVAIIVLKLTSLLVYGYFISKLYRASKNNPMLDKENKRWQKNIFVIHISYVVCYFAYGFLLANNVIFGPVYYMQIICMAAMVMYIGYSANVQPDVFNGSVSFNKLFYKYEKSGLTKSLSKELKENLVDLFDKEKIYKESNISLESLALQLNTTRHNASQVINEHFQMSFYELVNSYRIQEAKEILTDDLQKNLNIIDVAYEVGYNNKVTFNKAFKKDTQLTPSQYQRIAVGA